MNQDSEIRYNRSSSSVTVPQCHKRQHNRKFLTLWAFWIVILLPVVEAKSKKEKGDYNGLFAAEAASKESLTTTSTRNRSIDLVLSHRSWYNGGGKAEKKEKHLKSRDSSKKAKTKKKKKAYCIHGKGGKGGKAEQNNDDDDDDDDNDEICEEPYDYSKKGKKGKGKKKKKDRYPDYYGDYYTPAPSMANSPAIDPPVGSPVAAPMNVPVAPPTLTPSIAAPVAVPNGTPIGPPISVPVTTPVVGPPVATPVDTPIASPVSAPVAGPVDPPIDPPVTAPADSPVRPIDTPVATPVAPPADAPVTGNAGPPINPPVATPVGSPVSAPVSVPVVSPASSPQAAPIAGPVDPPVVTPVSTPVNAPVTPPIASPVSSPVTPPATTPVATPLSAPVAAPVALPVAAPAAVPATTPVNAPVSPPVDTPVAPPLNAPPIASPVAPPVSDPVSPPVQAPVDAPIDPPVTSPVIPPVNPPVTAPIPATPSPTVNIVVATAAPLVATTAPTIQNTDAPTQSPQETPQTDSPTQSPQETPQTDSPTQGEAATASPTVTLYRQSLPFEIVFGLPGGGGGGFDGFDEFGEAQVTALEFLESYFETIFAGRDDVVFSSFSGEILDSDPSIPSASFQIEVFFDPSSSFSPTEQEIDILTELSILEEPFLSSFLAAFAELGPDNPYSEIETLEYIPRPDLVLDDRGGTKSGVKMTDTADVSVTPFRLSFVGTKNEGLSHEATEATIRATLTYLDEYLSMTFDAVEQDVYSHLTGKGRGSGDGKIGFLVTVHLAQRSIGGYTTQEIDGAVERAFTLPAVEALVISLHAMGSQNPYSASTMTNFQFIPDFDAKTESSFRSPAMLAALAMLGICLIATLCAMTYTTCKQREARRKKRRRELAVHSRLDHTSQSLASVDIRLPLGQKRGGEEEFDLSIDSGYDPLIWRSGSSGKS